jgi:hypothetical protein
MGRLANLIADIRNIIIMHIILLTLKVKSKFRSKHLALSNLAAGE